MFLSKTYLSLAALTFSSVTFSQFNFESPAESSIESGVGVVRGWACNAEKIQVIFDDKETLDLPYGGDRPDTNSICNNDGKNGFGSVIFWPTHGEGQHTADLLIDDEIVTSVTFMVSGASSDFIKGISGNVTAKDFPSEGSSKNLIWSQANQNFVFAQDPPKPSATPEAKTYTRRLVSRRHELDGRLSQVTSYNYLETGVNAGRQLPSNAYKIINYDLSQETVEAVQTGTVRYDKWGRLEEGGLLYDDVEPYEDTSHTSKFSYASAPKGLLISQDNTSIGYISRFKSRVEPEYESSGRISRVHHTSSGIGQQSTGASDIPVATGPSEFNSVATPTYANGVVTSVSISNDYKSTDFGSRKWVDTYEIDYQDDEVIETRETGFNGYVRRTWIVSSDATHIVVHTQTDNGSITADTYTYEDGICNLGPNDKNKNEISFLLGPDVHTPNCR